MKTDRSLYFSRIVKKKICKIFISLPSIQELEILQDHMKSIWFNNVSKCVQAKNKIKSKFCSLIVAVWCNWLQTNNFEKAANTYHYYMYILLHMSSEYKNKASQRLQIKTFKTSKLEPNRRFGAVLILAERSKKATFRNSGMCFKIWSIFNLTFKKWDASTSRGWLIPNWSAKKAHNLKEIC